MDRLAIVFGLLLCGLTAVGLFASAQKSPAQFMPMMFGIPTLLCGVVSLNPHRRRQAMLLAVSLGVVGLLIAGGRSIATTLQVISGRDVNQLAFRIVLAMTAICGLFVATWIIRMFRTRRGKAGDSIPVRSEGPMPTRPRGETAGSDPPRPRVEPEGSEPHVRHSSREGAADRQSQCN